MPQRPEAIDAQAWALVDQLLPRESQTFARGALRALAKRGWSTALNAQLTGEQLFALRGHQRFGLRRLWELALTRGERSHPIPTRPAKSPGCPLNIDPHAWELALTLEGQDTAFARRGLRKLQKRGLQTSLNVVVPTAVFLALTNEQRRGLRLLWSMARERGLRTAPVPDKQSDWLYRHDLEGVNDETVAFVRSHGGRRLSPYALLWLRRLRQAGLATDLDVDLEAPALRELLDGILNEAAKRMLGTDHEQLHNFRAAVRWMYTEACAQKKRTRPVPIEIARKFGYGKGAAAALITRLPQHDRDAIAALKEALRELNRLQQAARGQSEENVGVRAKKKTEAQTTSKMKSSALNSFLHHASRWALEDLAAGEGESGWSLEHGLAALMTPPHVARWAYKGHKPDGSPKERATCLTHHEQILRLLERAAEAGIPIVTCEGFAAIKAELERVRDNEEWNVPSALEEDPDEYEETGKWFPTLDQLKAGFAALREDWQRAKLAHENGGPFRRYWRETRDFVMAYGALLCMWRVDTTGTIDLSRVMRDPITRLVRWRDGTMRIRNGARAKQAHGHSYLVKMLIIPGEVVDLIEMLLEIEGRSLEHRLRPGEEAVLLAKGDRYGHDELLEASRTVIPLFRAEFDVPTALNVGSVTKRLQARLFAMGWDATNPHTLRAAGAIEWRFVRGRTYEAIMRLGLWNDESVLKRCYARLNTADIDAEIANGAPSLELVSPVGSNELAKALEEAQYKALALRIKPDAPAHELVATARVLRVAASRLEKAAGAADRAERPSPFRSDEDLVRIDQALRPVQKGGVNGLLGYEALRPTKEQREKPPRTERRMLSRLRAETRSTSMPRATRRSA